MKNILKTLLVVALALLPLGAEAVTWNLVLQDGFTGRSVPTSANGAGGTNVGSPDTLGSGAWIDSNGGVYSIQTSGQLRMIPDATNTSQYFRDYLKRPTGEATQDQRIVFTLPAQTTTKTVIGAGLRLQSAGNAYLLSYAPCSAGGSTCGVGMGNGFVSLYKITGNGTVVTQIGTNLAATTAYNAAHTYTVDVSAYGVSPTNLSVIVTDTTASAVVAALSNTDTETTLQNNTGVPSIDAYSSPAATSGMVLVTSEAQIYASTATSFSFSGPSTGATGSASSNFTLTPNGSYTGTVSLSDGGAGGTFTPSSLTWSGTSTAQTFTYTAAISSSITITPTASPTVTSGISPTTLTYTSSSGSATSMSFSGPSSGTEGVASTNFTLTPNGTYTGTVTLGDGSSGGTFTPASLTWSGTSSAKTFTYTPSASGSYTLTPSASPTLTSGISPTTLSYTGTNASVSLTSSNVLLSPYTFDSNLRAVNAGSYFKANVTVNSTTNLFLSINTSLFSAITDTSKPYLAWTVDGGAEQTLQLTTSNTSTGSITLASSLASGAHSVKVSYRGSDPFQDHWTPVVCFQPTAISVNSGTIAVSQSSAYTNIVEFLGDSITEGEGTDGFVSSGNRPSYAQYSDATHNWVPALANTLNAEYAQIGFGGQGWTSGGADGHTPGLTTSYSSIYSGVSRTYSPAPNYAFINMGTNGNTAGSSGTVSTFLTNFRSAVGSSTKIFMLIPFNGSVRSTSPNLISEFQTYQGGSANVYSVTVDGITIYKGSHDQSAYLIDLGAQAQTGLVLPAATNSAGSIASYDTTHPSSYGSVSLAGLVARGVQIALTNTNRWSHL